MLRIVALISAVLAAILAVADTMPGPFGSL